MTDEELRELAERVRATERDIFSKKAILSEGVLHLLTRHAALQAEHEALKFHLEVRMNTVSVP
jgi:hypothetical protein